MHNWIVPVALALALAIPLAGCEENDGEEESTSASLEESQAQGGGGEPAELGQPSGHPEPAGKLNGPSGGPGGDRQQAMKKQLEAMQEQQQMRAKAIAAAQEAEGQGDSRCGKAFHAAVAMGESIREQRGEESSGEPDKSSFVSACKKLPDQMQECMVPSYGTQHPEECREAQQQLDPQMQQQLQAMMQQAQ